MDNNVKKYRYWEWRTIIVLFVGYALFYFVRKNLGMAIPAMEAELGISKTQLGIFLTLHSIIYGFSRFVNGMLVDRFSKRKIMSLGLLLTCAVNLFICFSPKLNGMLNLLDTEGKATLGLVYLIGSMWVLNGYLQGMGVPPCVSLLAHWVKPSELATKQSIWNVSHTVGAGVVVALCGFMLDHYGYSAWYLCFAVPALIALIGVPVLWFGLKDDPTEVGLPPVEKMGEEPKEKSDEPNPLDNIDGAKYKKIINKMVKTCDETEESGYRRMEDQPFVVIRAAGSLGVDLVALRWDFSFPIEVKSSSDRTMHFSRNQRLTEQATNMMENCMKSHVIPIYAMRLKNYRGDPWRLFALPIEEELRGSMGLLQRKIPKIDVNSNGNYIMRWDDGMKLSEFMSYVSMNM